MYYIPSLLEIGSAEELIMGTKPRMSWKDISIPSEFPLEQFDE